MLTLFLCFQSALENVQSPPKYLKILPLVSLPAKPTYCQLVFVLYQYYIYGEQDRAKSNWESCFSQTFPIFLPEREKEEPVTSCYSIFSKLIGHWFQVLTYICTPFEREKNQSFVQVKGRMHFIFFYTFFVSRFINELFLFLFIIGRDNNNFISSMYHNSEQQTKLIIINHF